MNKAVCIKEEKIYRIKIGFIYEYYIESTDDGYYKYVFHFNDENLNTKLHIHPNSFDNFFIKLETYRDNQINSLLNE